MAPLVWLLAACGAYSLLHRLLGGATFMHSFLPATHEANATQFFTRRGRWGGRARGCARRAAPSEALAQRQGVLMSSIWSSVQPSDARLTYLRGTLAPLPPPTHCTSTLLERLRHDAPSLLGFRPSLWLRDGHWQTLYTFVARVPRLPGPSGGQKLRFMRQRLQAADGGTLSVDWAVPSEQAAQAEASATRQSSRLVCDVVPPPWERDSEVGAAAWRGDAPSRPVLLLTPGLSGHTGTAYVAHAALEAQRRGWRFAAWNWRGVGADNALTSPMVTSPFHTADLRQIVEHIRAILPEAPIVAVANSLGGTLLVRYLAEYGEDAQIAAAATMCSPYCLLTQINSFAKKWKFYEKSVMVPLHESLDRFDTKRDPMRGLCRQKNYATWKAAHEAAVTRGEAHMMLDPDEVLASRTIHEYDTVASCRLYGYRHVLHYYQEASVSHLVPEVKVPLLALFSADDPLVEQQLPREWFEEQPHTVMAVTPHGGHLGFYGGPVGSLAPWWPRATLDFFEVGAGLR